MKNAYVCLFIVMNLCVLSCNDNSSLTIETPERLQEKPKEKVKFTSSIAKSTIISLKSETDWGNGTIGVLMFKSGQELREEDYDKVKKYSLSSESIFNSQNEDDELFLPNNGTFVDFISFYPIRSVVNGDYFIDVSDQTIPEENDFRISKNAKNINYKEGRDEKGNVSLEFVHQLVNLEFNITHQTEADMTGLQLSVEGMNTRATFSFKEESLINDETSKKNMTVMPKIIGNDAYCEMIILPNISKDVRYVFYIPSLGQSFSWSVPDGQEFKQNHKYVYNIELRKSGDVYLTTSSEVIDWTREEKDLEAFADNSSITLGAEFFEDFGIDLESEYDINISPIADYRGWSMKYPIIYSGTAELRIRPRTRDVSIYFVGGINHTFKISGIPESKKKRTLKFEMPILYDNNFLEVKCDEIFRVKPDLNINSASFTIPSETKTIEFSVINKNANTSGFRIDSIRIEEV